MKNTLEKAFVERNLRRTAAINTIKSTQSRLKPKNLKEEAVSAVKVKTKTAAHKARQIAKSNRPALMAAGGIAISTALGLFFYKPVKKWLSRDRKI